MCIAIESNPGIDNSGLFLKGIKIVPASKSESWLYRIQLAKGQALICFRKYLTIGIGFQIERMPGTDVPFDCETREILNLIKCNKRFTCISDDTCIKAIEALQLVLKRNFRNLKFNPFYRNENQ